MVCAGMFGCRLVASEAADTVVSLQEVSVTAIKETSSMALRPEASTVVGAGMIQRLNIVTMKEVSELAPNFYIPDYARDDIVDICARTRSQDRSAGYRA